MGAPGAFARSGGRQRLSDLYCRPPRDVIAEFSATWITAGREAQLPGLCHLHLWPRYHDVGGIPAGQATFSSEEQLAEMPAALTAA
jgi:hypothetical protein